ncbi:hypothetical protein HDE78_000238 [Rhodanobacter sp. K2T2]|uniref:DUF3631 domain-containing protein n=1 Tax=Rhodanobacter sp. K2T2 TaxID=2723085 RepID=UPI001858FD53|nr:DUF3631 domain-containing protein [Rhodanobacter sp. K2T2]NYE27313.1 hypothetical protein [Rhodanobacter sp. K2T2]
MNALLKVEHPKEAAARLAAGAVRDGYKPQALHVYADADGRPSYWRIRCKHPETGEKWTRPMRWNGATYVVGEPPASANGKLLYRLPELLANAAAPVLIVEGEWCADHLHKLGLTVTTSGSAASAAGADWSPLEGRRCIIWPDNDKAGSTYADDVTAQLRAMGCSVERIDVETLGLPDKGDAVDWLAIHPDASAVEVLALAGPAVDAAASKPDLIGEALAKMPNDAGALFEPSVLLAIMEVRQTDAASYARIRAEAKAAKVSVGELDRLTAPVRESTTDKVFSDVDPWFEPVDGSALLADICKTLHEHVIADGPTITAAALWSMHTWCMDALTVSPLAHITAPEKRCGKTVLLTALSRLAYRPLPVSNISPAALFRSMELWQPTLLIDEADTFLRDNEEARGLINSGLYRETAFVLRTAGDEHTPTAFRTWGAKVVCGIGKLADTIEDRSIPLRMRRKVPGESVHNIRLSDRQIWMSLQSRMARWADDNRDCISCARPLFAHGLNDRAQDCWEPLLAIADICAGEWPGKARAAALALHGVEEETPSIGAELLRDVTAVFDRRMTTRLATAIVIEELTKDDELPWSTWNRGRPISPRQLSARLGEFGIKSKNLKMSNGSVPKGYDLNDFRDAIHRYLSPGTPVLSATPLQPHSSAVCETFASATAPAQVAPTNAPRTALQSQSSVVADKNTPSAERNVERSNATLEVLDI